MAYPKDYCFNIPLKKRLFWEFHHFAVLDQSTTTNTTDFALRKFANKNQQSAKTQQFIFLQKYKRKEDNTTY